MIAAYEHDSSIFVVTVPMQAPNYPMMVDVDFSNVDDADRRHNGS